MPVEVIPLLAAELSLPEAYAMRPEGNAARRLAALVRREGETLRSPCLAYVLRHPDHGALLVDTGLHPDAHRSVTGDYGPLLGRVFASLRPSGAPFDAQLRDAGVEPGEVTTAVMTHLHVDHTSGMRLLPNATFVLSAAEWAAASGPAAVRKGYRAEHLPGADRVRTIDLEREGTTHGPFAHTVDLLGDGTVRLVSTPGHTRGHLSVLLERPGGAPVLIAGDAAYTLRSIDEQRLPFLTDGDAAARDTLRRLGAFRRERPDAVVVPTHDPGAWHALA